MPISMNDEYWKQIPEFPNYEASTLGNIRRTDTKREISQYTNKMGYKIIRIYNKNGEKSFNVHSLIMITFSEENMCCPLCRNKKEINHKNFDKSDSRLSNLEFVSPTENKKHADAKISENARKWKLKYNSNKKLFF
jgi:hypothetical protein